MTPNVNPNFLWYYCFHGRLGNVCYELCHLYDYMKQNKIPLEKLVLDLNYEDVSYYHNSHQYVIRDNLPFFWFFKDNLKENFNDIPNKLIMWKSYKHKCKNLSDIAYRLFYNKDLYCKIEEQYPGLGNKTAIHVRRTDFLNKPGKGKILSCSHINKIIESNEPIAIFSDDMEYCKYKFSKPNVTFIHNEREYEDIIAMSLCREIHETPHSTFSRLAGDLRKELIKQGKCVLAS